MKKIRLTVLTGIFWMAGLAPMLAFSDNSNSPVKVCLASPIEDIASTTLACATVLHSFQSTAETVPDEVQNRIKELNKNGELHTNLRIAILEKMRLNRRAFQSEKVLNRYSESREFLADHAQVFEKCGLPRDNDGNPLPQYPASFANSNHGVKGHYKESKGVIGCLKTKSGLAGVRAEPLAQHYYCTFPGNSPEIRSCFTFQIRVSSNTRSNSHQNILIKDETSDEINVLDRAGKEWIFAGTQQEFESAKDTKIIPQNIINKVATYCSVDGRAARAKDFTVSPPATYWHTEFLEEYLREVELHNDPAETNEDLITEYLLAKSEAESSGTDLLNISKIDPIRNEESKIKPPLCWINNTQISLFQLMLSPALTMYFDRDDQLSMIKDYYQCDDEGVTQTYTAQKMKNYCPENFDIWDD